MAVTVGQQDTRNPGRSPWLRVGALRQWLSFVLLAAAALLVSLHFTHLAADFPHNALWKDPARATDEGWYAGAALRALLSGHWRLAGDFNPAAALPVFPALAYLLFRITGVSVVALRALNVTCFAASVAALWVLARRHSNTTAAGLAVLLFAASPLYFVYSRMGILEPLLALEMLVALLLADAAPPKGGPVLRDRAPGLWRAILLGLLMAAMLLTKTTGICAFPALLYLFWMRSPERRSAVRNVAVALLCCGAAVCAYIGVVRHAGLMPDFINLFAINNDRINKHNAAITLVHALRESRILGYTLLVVFAVAATARLFLRRVETSARGPQPISNALLLAIAGFGAFITYHGWLMPRYYLPLVPLLVLICTLSLNAFLESGSRQFRIAGLCMAVALVVAAVSQSVTVLRWTLHPSYSFRDASQSVVAAIEAEGEQDPAILSTSAEQIALLSPLHGRFMTVPFGTAPLGERVRELKPGWMVAFDAPEQSALQALQGFATPHLVLVVPALGDDATHHRLMLYRLVPMH